MLRDLPRYVTLMEKGVIDMKSVVTATYPLERAMEASYRAIVTVEAGDISSVPQPADEPAADTVRPTTSLITRQ